MKQSRAMATDGLLLFAILILILNPTSAQTPTPQTPPPATTIKVSTRLVTVDVVVQDKKGQPDQGLTKDDFELWEDGEQQGISVFSVEGSLTPPAPVVGPQATLPLHTVTNQLAGVPDAPATATVILLDELNTNMINLAMARSDVAKFIRQMGPRDRVALYSLGANVRVLQDFTSDSALLLKALAGMTAPRAVGQLALPAPSGPPGEFVVQGVTGPGPILKNQPGWDPAIGFPALERPRLTMRLFAAIGEHLSHMPGRKTLIWISSAFPSRPGLPLPRRTMRPGRSVT